jgi:glyoxylase-like metal-dependent hydrolase (beta-lactamase superfamily II)
MSAFISRGAMSITLGRLSIDVLSDGEFRLDGGAMFGMVPRERWKHWCPPDEQNRIRLATHALLVRSDDFTLVIEAGISDDVDRELFAITKEPTLEESLATHGVDVAAVTHVLFTHLHFDHAGGGDRFPQATCIAQRREWQAMTSPDVLHSRSYRRKDRPPEGRLVLVDGAKEPLPGVAVRLTGGHSPGHQVVILEEQALFWGDLMPTQHHLSPPRFMAYDLVPQEVAQRKIALLAESAEKGWLNFLYHEPDPTPRRLVGADGRYAWAEAAKQ